MTNTATEFHPCNACGARMAPGEHLPGRRGYCPTCLAESDADTPRTVLGDRLAGAGFTSEARPGWHDRARGDGSVRVAPSEGRVYVYLFDAYGVLEESFDLPASDLGVRSLFAILDAVDA